MPETVRIATFNVENLEDKQLDAFQNRVELMRPQLQRLRASILCLQEVHGQREHGIFGLRALNTLLADTPYAGYHRVATVAPEQDRVPEDLTPLYQPANEQAPTRSVRDQRNLLVLSRFPMQDHRQFRHALVNPPVYQPITGTDHSVQPVIWERPLLYTKVVISPEIQIHVIVLHLKSKLPTSIKDELIEIPGERIPVWKSATSRAEGSFLSSMKRVGQALEVRRFIDSIFDQDEQAKIVVCGDCNSEHHEVPMEAIRGDIEDTNNPLLGKRVLIPAAKAIPEQARFSLYHHGKGNLFDHILFSRSLLAHFRGAEIHHETLHDESLAFATDKRFPESDHAPVVVEFVFP